MFVHNNLMKKANNLRKLNNSTRFRLKTSGSMNSLAENQTSLLNKSVSRGEMRFKSPSVSISKSRIDRLKTRGSLGSIVSLISQRRLVQSDFKKPLMISKVQLHNIAKNIRKLKLPEAKHNEYKECLETDESGWSQKNCIAKSAHIESGCQTSISYPSSPERRKVLSKLESSNN